LANRVRLALLLLLLGTGLSAELIKFSSLNPPRPAPKVKRNIFSLVSSLPLAMPPRALKEAPPPPPPERNVAEEIRQSVIFEGYVVKDGKRSAMISSSGEFFIVGIGDTVLEKIKILAISPTQCTVEFEGQPYEIYLKGGSDATHP